LSSNSSFAALSLAVFRLAILFAVDHAQNTSVGYRFRIELLQVGLAV